MPRRPNELTDAALRVLLARGIGPLTSQRLLDYFGSFEHVSQAAASALAQVEGIGPKRAATLRRELDDADIAREREAMDAGGATVVLRGDADYPPLLNAIPDPPPALWVRGDLRAEDNVAIGIVGSRRTTAYGREQAARFAALLSENGLTIVSGGARGVDAEAHRAALRVNGRTITVCGCGLAHTYPPEHEELFARIADGHGAVVSEYPMNTPPRAEHFPRRNRIISGLSLGVLVIEAGRGSGALITARVAAEEHGREVMALPGRADSPASRGCLEAIRDGWAAIVLDHGDVMVQLQSSRHLLSGAIQAQQVRPAVAGTAATAPSEPAPKNHFDSGMSEVQRSIVGALREANGPIHTDVLAARTQLPISRLMTELTMLQIRSVVARGDDGFRLSRAMMDISA